MLSDPLRSPLALTLVAGLNIALGFALAAGSTSGATLVAVLPALLVATAALIASNRAILVFGAFAVDLYGVGLREPVVGSSIYVSDILLALALGSWLAAWLIAPGGRRPSWPKTPLLGWPLVLFAIFVGAGVVRGHQLWGLSYLSQPARFVIYAGIAAAIADMTVRQAWHGLVVVFYLGAFWNAAAAVYYLATGTVQQEASSGLTTGGYRVLTLTTALFLTGALVLALLNVERERRTGRQVLHVLVGGLAMFGIVVSYGRGVWYAVAAVLIVLYLMRPRLRRATAVVLPLCLPFVVLGGLLLARGAPGFLDQVVDRATTFHSSDPSVNWREEAYKAIWAQVEESPIIGVGFGKEANFTADFTRFHITQDPHNSYLFLWAGGGLLTLGAFLLLYVLFVADSWRRYSSEANQTARALIAWCLSIWFCFAVNSLVEPQLTQANSILVLWILMLLPTVVPYARKERVALAV
jgi:O-antigen ligase